MSLPVAKCARSLFGTRGYLVMSWVQIASPLGVQTFCPTHMTNMTFSSKSSLVLLTGISSEHYLTNMPYVIYFYHHHHYYYYCYYLIIYLFFTAHPAILVLRPIPSWTTSIFIGQTIPSFAVDTHPLLPMRTIFVTRLQGLLKIACLWVKLQVLDPVQLCQLR